MDLTPLFRRVGKVAAENSPAILTSIGITGTLATAYLVAKAAFQSAKVLDAEYHKPEREEKPIEFKEATELTWKLYIPAATCAALTVSAIFCSNRISERRTAAMTAAYSIAKESYAEYRKAQTAKAPKRAQEVRDELAQERANRMPPNKSEIFMGRGGSVICRDEWSGRYFMSDHESVRAAVNDLNAKIFNENYVSLNDFWALLGLPPATGGNYLGWNTDELLKINTTTITMGEDRVLCIEFETLPVSKYNSAY